jgi:hypothetical protein
MSLFLLIYDRRSMQVIELREFDESGRIEADTVRFAAQRDALAAGLDQDIVLFQADSEQELRRTHGSYFLTVHELIERAQEAVGSR